MIRTTKLSFRSANKSCRRSKRSMTLPKLRFKEVMPKNLK